MMDSLEGSPLTDAVAPFAHAGDAQLQVERGGRVRLDSDPDVA